MKSAEQIKGAVKNIAKKMNLKPQEVLQIFMFERSQFLKRIWEKYKEENTYSEGIAFADTLDIVSWIGRELEKY